jgi:hypothetical protein
MAIKFSKVEQIIISEGLCANPYNLAYNSMRKGDDSHYSSHRSRGKYPIGSLLNELNDDEKAELADFNSERLARTEHASSLKYMEFVSSAYCPKKKKGRWGL